MIEQDEITVDQQTSGFTIGKLNEQHKKLRYLKPGTQVIFADGVDTLLDYVNEHMTEAKRGKSSVDTGRGDFNAFNTYDEAMEVFRTKPEQVVNFDPAELRIRDTNEAGNSIEYDVTGDFIDMGRYMEGIPESIGSMRSGYARNRRVNIIIDLNQIHYIKHEDITHRGERILRLIDALEAGGVRCQLTGIESNECGHTEILLKPHDEPLTITDLAVVAHPEFLRRIIFRIDEYSETWDWGYGSAVAFEMAVTPSMLDSGNNEELDILIGSNFRGKTTIDNSFEQLERLLVWEMSKEIPEVTSIKLDNKGLFFNPNGARSDSEIRREGQEIIRGE